MDDALLYLGITVLEKMRTSNEYAEGKRSCAFHAEMRRLASNNGSMVLRVGMTEGETLIRTAFLSKVPKELLRGGRARINIFLGGELERIKKGCVNHQFDGSHTLKDVLNWPELARQVLWEWVAGEDSRQLPHMVPVQFE